MSREPYKAGLIKENPYRARRAILGEIVAILDLIIDERGMQLIDPMSRALPQHSICELAITDEDHAGPSQLVNHVGYLGFLEVKAGGVAVTGDNVYISDKMIGMIAGFDTTHTPNHINVVLKVDQVTTGDKLNLKIGDRVTISMSP